VQYRDKVLPAAACLIDFALNNREKEERNIKDCFVQ
jgi:hypothetical protein